MQGGLGHGKGERGGKEQAGAMEVSQSNTTMYEPRSILVTGGAGFIGSHVVLLLLKKYPQYKIVNLDKLDYCSSLKNLGDLSSYENYKFIRGNICSADLLNYIFSFNVL